MTDWRIAALFALCQLPILFLLLGLVIGWRFGALPSRASAGTRALFGLGLGFFMTACISIMAMRHAGPYSGPVMMARTLGIAPMAWISYLFGILIYPAFARLRPKPLTDSWFENRFGIHWMLLYTWMVLFLPHIGTAIEMGWRVLRSQSGIFFWMHLAEGLFIFQLGWVSVQLNSVKRR